MAKFPIDAPLRKVLRAFQRLGFQIVREGNHISLSRANPDGTRAPMTVPNHRFLKGATLRLICTQAGIERREFMQAFERS